MLIFKIVHASEWREAEQTGIYTGSATDQADGFLHFSTATQLRETLERYYSGATNLILVAVETSTLSDDVKWEYSRSRGEDFPHLYAHLSLKAVKWARPLDRDVHGDPVV